MFICQFSIRFIFRKPEKKMEDGASRPCHSSSGQDIRQPILSPRTDSYSNSTPPSKTSFSNISSMTSSEISPASNNSEGTPNPSEDLQSETDDAGKSLSSSLEKVHCECCVKHIFCMHHF